MNPNIDVIGLGLSPRGNDNPTAASNVSTSPVRFIRDLGQAYRTSARNAPIMDELAFHPYPNQPTDGLDSGYQWPNAGFANLDRIKQAVWDAFHGTAQPVFQEGGPTASSVWDYLKLRLDEVGWQVAIPAANAGAYTGAENVKTTDEATQAQIYSDLVKRAGCDADISRRLVLRLHRRERPRALPGRLRPRRRHASPLLRRGQGRDRPDRRRVRRRRP